MLGYLTIDWKTLMQVTTTEVGRVFVVTVIERRLDAAVALKFKEMMLNEFDKQPDHIILDLSQVEFLDSSGLGAMVGTMKCLGRGRQIDLAGLTPGVEKIFKITRMDKVFRIFPTIESALEEAPIA